MLLTDKVFFDTDCLSAFLWTQNQSILPFLYPGKIVIPYQVYRELSNPNIRQLKERVDQMTRVKVAKVESIAVDTAEYDLYRKLTAHPDAGHKIIDDGEAAAIAMAKERNGILASNNLRDIEDYVNEFGIEHVTTGDIMKEAYRQGVITETEGNTIWSEMLAKKRWLGYASFTEFLDRFGR